MQKAVKSLIVPTGYTSCSMRDIRTNQIRFFIFSLRDRASSYPNQAGYTHPVTNHSAHFQRTIWYAGLQLVSLAHTPIVPANTSYKHLTASLNPQIHNCFIILHYFIPLDGIRDLPVFEIF